MSRQARLHAQKMLHKGRQTLRNLALDLGLLPGQKDYVKFFILGRSRIGSNLLRSLLNAHSQVEAYGEIFRHPDAMDWDHIGTLDSARMQARLLADPVQFVDRRVFRRYPAETAAVGFKLFYYHARDDRWSPIWPYLQARTDLRVVHMKRRNILKTHLSRKRAELTDRWVNTSGRREQPVAVTLDYDDCLADLQRTRAWEEEGDVFFSAHSRLTLYYEDLARDYAGEMARVFHFLDLPLQPVTPAIYKQSHLPLASAITNYEALKARFAGSPWESFFAEAQPAGAETEGA